MSFHFPSGDFQRTKKFKCNVVRLLICSVSFFLSFYLNPTQLTYSVLLDSEVEVNDSTLPHNTWGLLQEDRVLDGNVASIYCAPESNIAVC